MRAFKAARVGGICSGLVLILVGVLGFSATAYAETQTFNGPYGQVQTFLLRYSRQFSVRHCDRRRCR